jgi:hypothetical protein
MTDTEHNEHTLIRKIMVGVVVLELAFTLFVMMMGSNIVGLGCDPQSVNTACTIQNSQSQINSTMHSFTGSFDCVVNTSSTNNCWVRYPAPVNTNSTFCLFSGCPIQNAYNVIASGFVALVNGVFGIITALFYIVALVFLAFELVYGVLFVMIPAIFQSAGLGAFGIIFGYVYGAVALIILGYGIYLARNIIPGLH